MAEIQILDLQLSCAFLGRVGKSRRPLFPGLSNGNNVVTTLYAFHRD